MELLTGTSGFSYKEWKGEFYPDDLPAKQFLSYYASRLPAVEINNTFYRLPRESVLEDWSDQTPDGFKFVLKASRQITHFKRLKGADEQTDYLMRTAGALGDKLGVVLFQLPPNMKKDVERLNRFLDHLALPERAAFEFRHDSWFDDEVYECLRSRDSALVTADTDEEDGHIVRTAPWGYLRLRKTAYDDEALEAWATAVQDQDWATAYVFFKHEDAASGPKLAERFQGMV